jgi:hypothetical protein
MKTPVKGLLIFCLMLASTLSSARTVGVLFVIHGGSDEQDVANTFDSTLQFFQYDPNNVIFKGIIWNPQMWPRVVSGGDSQAYANAASQLKKYRFEYERIGGKDPAPGLAETQLRDMTAELRKLGRKRDITFVTDLVQWIGTQQQADRLPWPRYLYNPQVPRGAKLTYCGSNTDGGPWPGCDPERFNVDGPGERLLKQGASEIVMIDMTVGGVRFWKTYDVVAMTRRMVADWNQRNGTSVTVRWVNDATDLMAESYPRDPPNWTRALGPPRADSRVPLDGRANPVIVDPLLTDMMVDGVAVAFDPAVSKRRTAVLFVNHATRDGNETYDPKIDDTLVLDDLIKQALLRRYPGLAADNILGSWMGIREANPQIKPGKGSRGNRERTRAMRGEDLGSAWLYESDRQMPSGDHRYRYWDALDLLRQRDVGHIVVIFSQIVIDSVLNLVELPNQVAKEIGRRTWRETAHTNRRAYPGFGNPFAPYWGNWIDTQCRLDDAGQPAATGPCCLTMGGCGDGRPYPPPRQTPPDRPREDTDPSLGFDVSAYGHLGYDASLGPPSEMEPVQRQYRGTWSLWKPANDDPRMGRLLARQVVRFLEAYPSARKGEAATASSQPVR